jgi:microcompartment protein CcmL/EutN
MDGYALGLIETRGKVAAIEAADAALKSANVVLHGVENATGALITVKVTGDVGAVRAAVDAARARASLIGEVVAVHVLPRPAPGIRLMVRPLDAPAASGAAGLPSAAVPGRSAPEREASSDSADTLPSADCDPAPESRETALGAAGLPSAAAPGRSAPEREESSDRAAVLRAATCNICNDPLCPRKKGEPYALCIHHKKRRAK